MAIATVLGRLDGRAVPLASEAVFWYLLRRTGAEKLPAELTAEM